MNTNEIIRPLVINDAEEIANLHLNAFPNFFLTSLGKGFLINFYNSVIVSKEGFGIGIFNDRKLISFAIGTTQTHGFYKKIIMNFGLKLVFSALPALLKKPANGIRIVNNLTANNNDHNESKSGGWLLSICTNPDFQGKNISQRCLNEFENLSIKNDLNKIWLTTDFLDNEKANRFYIKQGYQLSNTFTNANKRQMNLYFKKI